MSSNSSTIASKAWSVWITPRGNGVGAKARPVRLRKVLARLDERRA